MKGEAPPTSHTHTHTRCRRALVAINTYMYTASMHGTKYLLH